MRRFFVVALLEFVICTFVTDSAVAQRGPRIEDPVGRAHLMQPVLALESYTVRQALKLTDQQEEKAKAIVQSTKEARRKLGRFRGGDFESLSEQQRQERLVEYRETYEADSKAATALLDAAQMARFNQLRIWIARERALLSAEVVEELKLDDAQKSALAEIWRKTGQKMQEIPIPAEGTDEEKRQKRQDQGAILRRQMGDDFLTVLTAEQREQFDKMRGLKFEVEWSEFPTVVGDDFEK
jgi:hypothetical protein